MLPAHPPHSRRMSLIWNATDSMCVCSGRIWRANRSGNTMMVSNASEPQIRVRIGAGAGRDRAQCSAAMAQPSPTMRERVVRLRAKRLRRRGAVHRFASDFTDDVLLASRHRQRLGDAVQQHFPVRIAVVVRAPLESADEIARDEAVAMHADESRAEFLLEARQRFLEQILALRGADRDV